MYELSDDPTHPTLSDRLRDAAVDRARTEGNVIDDVVIDETGVIDLRVPDYTELGTATELAAQLATTQGELASAHDVSGLYAPETETRRPWWRLGRIETDDRESLSSPELAALPASDEVDLRDEATTAAPAEPLAAVVVEPTEPAIDADDEPDEPDEVADERPTGTCPDCGGKGERDLYDPFSRTEYFSCNDCLKMWQEPRA